MKKIYLFLVFLAAGFLPAKSQITVFSENFASVPAMLSTGGWTQTNHSNPVGPGIWHDGYSLSATVISGVSQDGHYAEATYASTDSLGAGDINNWLISPALVLHNGDIISFFTTSYNNLFYPDRLEFRINPLNTLNVGSTATSTGDFSILLLSVNPNLLADTSAYPQDYWGQFSGTVSGLAGPTTCRMAFRYFVTNGGGTGTNSSTIGVDSLTVTTLVDHNSITGKIFLDANSNGVQDSGEIPLPYKTVTDMISSRSGYSWQNGLYDIAVFDTGSFLVTPQALNYYTPVPASHTGSFSALNLTDSLNDFAFQPIAVFNDLCLSLTPTSMFRAGRNASYVLNYENNGTTSLNGTVILFPDSNLIFLSATPSPSVITPDSIVWNTGTLNPFQSGSILVTTRVINTAPSGTPILSNARIEPVAGDANTYCNFAYSQVLTTGSYDPNDIMVDRSVLFTAELVNPPYLDYIINFQNTGNDTALNIRVDNPIDTNMLQVNTLEYIASSNPVDITFKPLESKMQFLFSNILLPDSNVNEPASHGFVRYRIKPKSSLLAGDTIRNTAFIYFDFNPAVQTNTALTAIILPAAFEELQGPGLHFSVYPNPLTSQATIAFSNPKHMAFELALFDMTGRLAETSATTLEKIVVDKGNKPAGVYLLRLTNRKTGEQAFGKIIIGN